MRVCRSSYSTPPPAPYVYVEARPGYAWVDGYYYWNDAWLWRPGYYVAERPGYTYVQGSYYGRSYRPGYWAPRQTVRVTPSRPARLYVQPQQRVAPAARPAQVGPSQRVRVIPGHR
jgi:hypothetical protein